MKNANSTAKTLIEEINSIREQWQAEVSGNRRAWPKAIKERVFQLIDMEISRKQIAQLTGVSYETLCVWQHKRRKTKLSTPGFHNIKVKNNENATVTVTDFKSEISVKTPKGFEFSGLNSQEFSELIRCLGGLRAL